MQSKRILESGMTFNRYAFGQQHCACRVKYRVIGAGNGIVRKAGGYQFLGRFQLFLALVYLSLDQFARLLLHNSLPVFVTDMKMAFWLPPLPDIYFLCIFSEIYQHHTLT